MSTQYSPQIVTNGLVLALDAGNPKSITSGSLTWSSLTNPIYSGSLASGSYYTPPNLGSIVFDGVDDYADFTAPNITSTASVEMWVKLGPNYNNKMFFGWNLYDVYCQSFAVGYNTSNSDVYGLSSASFNALGTVGNWAHYIFEMYSGSYLNNKIYINGISYPLTQVFSTQNSSQTVFNNGNGRIALWRSGTGYNIPMSCSIFKVYNKTLTPHEIQQNYNATKARFGL